LTSGNETRTRGQAAGAASFDAIVIGGGHNGLVCAGYLSKKGFSVAVVEQKGIVGGCVVTEEVAPGWKINTYGMEHYVIQSGPIISDLKLSRYGLRYYALEPTVFAPFKDGNYMLFHRNLDKTLSHIYGLSGRDARAYEKFHGRWFRVMQAIGIAAMSGPMSIEAAVKRHSNLDQDAIDEVLREAALPASKILAETFETDYVASPVAFLGPAAVGQSPSAPGTGWLVAWHIGAERVARAYGGSGALTQALARMIEANGGTIITDEKVVRILVRDGRAYGVETANGRTLLARVVASNADPKQTLITLMDEGDPLGTSQRRKVGRIKVSSGLTFKADYLLKEAPKYTCMRSRSTAGAATFIAPSVASLSKAYEEFERGRNPKEPGLMVAIHSITDPSLVPQGKEGLLLETRFSPYRIEGSMWTEERAKDEAFRLLQIFEQYAPGVSNLVERVRPITPPEMERDVMIPRGNFMHADMCSGQIFEDRPTAGILDGYRVRSIEGLYLCGSGAFPGGGISGAPGRNAARQIASDLGASW
jgi:phytoene dehydrogenase-like protein